MSCRRMFAEHRHGQLLDPKPDVLRRIGASPNRSSVHHDLAAALGRSDACHEGQSYGLAAVFSGSAYRPLLLRSLASSLAASVLVPLQSSSLLRPSRFRKSACCSPLNWAGARLRGVPAQDR